MQTHPLTRALCVFLAAATFNLSGFKPPESPGYFDVQGNMGQHDFYFMGCGTVATLKPTPLSCEQSQCQQPAAIQTWGQPAPQPPQFPSDSCAGLGSMAQAKCTHMNNATIQGLQCDFDGGDGGRTMSIIYLCSPTVAQPTAAQAGSSPGGGDHYVVTFTGPSACSGGGGGGAGGGWGKTFLILFPVFTGLYFAGGFAYNYKYKELTGAEAVPQIEYWRELPGLVKEGCHFSYDHAMAFIAWVQAQRAGNPNDAGLKQALASDEEGSSSSTAYEAKE